MPLGGARFLGARRAAVLAVPAREAAVARVRVVKNHLSAALALPFVSLGEDVAAARRAVSYANLTQRTGFVEGGQHRGLRHSGRKAAFTSHGEQDGYWRPLPAGERSR